MISKLSKKRAMIVFIVMQIIVMYKCVQSADWYPMDGVTDEDLHGVWGTSATDVFAVGDKGTIIHYDGTKWSLMDSGLTEEDYVDYVELNDVLGFSSNDVYVVGENSDALILHYNGLSWSSVPWALYAPNVSLFPYAFRHVWGTSSTELFITGAYASGTGGEWGLFCRFDGNKLYPIMSPFEETYSYPCSKGMWGSSSTDIYNVGGGGYYGYICHYDGETSSVSLRTETENENNEFKDIWGSSADDIFAVGGSGRIYHYDGSAWSRMDTGTEETFWCVWGTSSSDVYAAGGLGNSIIFHYDGSTWEPMDCHDPFHTHGTIESIWVSNFRKGFAVGKWGTIYVYGVPLTTTTTTKPPSTTTTTGGCTSEEIYGEGSEEVALLRYLRDNVLSQTPEGQEIIRLYYKLSPAIVRAMEEDDEFREEVKEMIEGVLGVVGE